MKVEDTDDGAGYELAHDYLVGEIKLDPELQARKAAQELLEQELRAFRRYGSLLSAERLQVIEPYQADLRLHPEAQQLLAESRAAVVREAQAEEARRAKELDDTRRLAQSEKQRAEEQARSAHRLRRRAMYLVVALVAALLLGSAAGVFGFRSNDLAVQNASIANSALTQSARAVAGEQSAATEGALADQRRQEAQAGETAAATAEAVANARRQEAQTAQALSRSRELAAAALNNLATDPQLSLLLALQAENVARTLNADDALRQALQRVPAISHLVTVPVAPSYAELAMDGLAELTPDHAYLAAVDNRGMVWVWRVADGDLVGQVGRGFDRFAVFSNQELLVASQATGEAHVFSLPALAEVRRLTLANASAALPLRNVQLLGDIVLGQTAEGRLHAWSASNGQELWATQAPVTLFRVSPPTDRILARRVLIADNATPPRIVAAQTGSLQATLAPDVGALVDATLCPEGNGLVTVDADQKVVHWSGDGQFPLSTTRYGSPVVIAPNCRWLAANTPAGAMRYELPYGSNPLLLAGQLALRFSDDGRYLVADQQTWETASGLPARSPGRVRLIAPDGQTLVALHVDAGQYVFSWADGPADPTEPLDSGETEVLRLRFSLNGQFLLAMAGRPPLGATCCPPPPSAWLHVWDSRTRQEVFRATDTVYASAEFTADGRRLLAAGADGRLYQWQVGTWQSLPALDLTSFWPTLGTDPIGLQVTSAQLSPRGDQLAVGTLVMAGDAVTPSVRVLDATAQRALSGLDSGAVLSLQFSPDGQRLLTSLGTGSFEFLATGVGDAELWDLGTSRLLATLTNDPGFANARFDPTGRAIATASGVGARLWDARIGAALGSACCHDDRINSVDFSPDGQRLVTASSDHTARVWDAYTGELLAILRGHLSWVTSAVFSPDGQWIVTGSEDGDIRWYAADTDALIRDAQAHVTRALTCDERKVYLAEAVVCPTPTPVVEHP